MRLGMRSCFGSAVPYPGSPRTCPDGADAAMMASQGRVPRWDRDRPMRTDVAIAGERALPVVPPEHQEAGAPRLAT